MQQPVQGTLGARGFAAGLGEWRRKDGPLARSFAAAVREAVTDGRIPAGTRLPSERELARELRVSRGTVVAALTALRDEGWLRTRQGSGSAVCLPPRLIERLAPWSQDQGGAGGADLDLTLAVTAAPHAAYLAALRRATGRSAPLLADSGTATAGLPRLRELIAERYTRSGLATRPEQILVTSGAQAALTLLAEQLHTDRGRPVLVESPTYPGAPAVLRRRARMVTVPVTSRDGWDTERLAGTVRASGARLAYLIPDFHNPTGALMPGGTRAEVAAVAERHGLTVVADETMRALDLRTPPEEVPHLSGSRVVQIGSMSKVLWSGLRTGWIRAGAGLVRELLRNPLQGQLSAAPLEQLIAAELLEDGLDAVIADRRDRLRAQRDHLVRLLAGTEWTFTVPDGGLTLWIHLGRGVTATELAARVARRGLAVSPGPVFAADRTTLAHYLRLPFTAESDTLTRAVGLLRELEPRP
ncbi:PLP-dependent aminotransferase family protein [Streptomyces sp. GC420]|uniref:aminotransferase-like domain-containing protein n=1 Tax=Streptomyces sp. GC420 TaxID=2697568 RepID=UPI001414E3C6|nr:PLP-dependent aminotransferase family protein [Streptomyces sp. GC420]NBM14489.1 aminotransferase class I/II-fold pyridoxal phosphate-dependent enzyme [Streptomyces sp. GC420]